MERIAEASPRLKARIAGVLYLLVFVAGIFAEVFVRGRLIVYGDAAATARNILASESLWRLGGAAELIMLACDTGVALIFYELLKPVNRSLSLLAAFFRLVHVAIVAIDSLNYLAPLVLLGGAHHLSVFTVEQLQALALTLLEMRDQAYNIVLVFFGFHCLLIGYLIFRSVFLPRILGVLMVLAGLCYLTNSFANFLAPAFAAHLYPYILAPCLLGEGLLTLWLLVLGVNVQRWKEQASAAGIRQ